MTLFPINSRERKLIIIEEEELGRRELEVECGEQEL